MKYYEKIIFTLVALNSLTRVWALPSFDSFSDATASGGTVYANGVPLYHQTNALGESWAQWNGGNESSAIICTNVGLSYNNFPSGFPAPSPTNAIYIPGNLDHSGGLAGQSAALTFSRTIKADPNNFATNTIFASFLLKVPNVGTLNSSGPTYFGGFATNSGDQILMLPASALKIFLKGDSATSGQSTTWAIGVADNSGSGSAVFDGGGHSTNEIVFVVVEYEFGINGNSDVARLWVNPVPASFSQPNAPAAIGSISIFGVNKIAQAADFFLLDRTGSTLWGGLLVSDLRVGASWSYVTGGPEINPPTGPILSISAAGGNLILSSANGTPGATNFLLRSTNVLLPLTNWTAMATNSFDGNGHFTLTNPLNASVKQQFFALQTILPSQNDLWVPTCGALLGAACTNGTVSAFNAHEEKIGRQLDVLRIYHTPGSWTKLTSTELSYINAGRKLLESVKPSNDWTNAIGAANGGSATVDAQMTSLAQSIASIKPMKIMLIVFHEPENNVTGSVPGANSGSPATYVAMWHNVRSIFDGNGATNVIWCWDIQNISKFRSLVASLWPGNSYVDWVMWDQYADASDSFTNGLQTAYDWMSANSTASNNYLSKPWGLAEWGVGINNYYPTVAAQTNGINGLNNALNKYDQFPKLKLVEYFDELAPALLPGSTPTYSNFANSPYMEQQCPP